MCLTSVGKLLNKVVRIPIGSEKNAEYISFLQILVKNNAFNLRL